MRQLHNFDKAAEVMPRADAAAIEIFQIGDHAGLFQPTAQLALSNVAIIGGLGLLCWVAIGSILFLLI